MRRAATEEPSEEAWHNDSVVAASLEASQELVHSMQHGFSEKEMERIEAIPELQFLAATARLKAGLACKAAQELVEHTRAAKRAFDSLSDGLRVGATATYVKRPKGSAGVGGVLVDERDMTTQVKGSHEFVRGMGPKWGKRGKRRKMNDKSKK